MEKDFITPPNHVNFLAKQLFGSCGEIENVAVAHLQSNGGGPTTQHSHPHSHLFIVTKGEAKVLLGNDVHIIHKCFFLRR